jgi:hypothetical protein
MKLKSHSTLINIKITLTGIVCMWTSHNKILSKLVKEFRRGDTRPSHYIFTYSHTDQNTAEVATIKSVVLTVLPLRVLGNSFQTHTVRDPLPVITVVSESTSLTTLLNSGHISLKYPCGIFGTLVSRSADHTVRSV